ncbi:MAG: branched-chain amino acid ABC transporter permease [Armatimonadota bacterium]
MEQFVQQLINGSHLGATYALIALGYTMVYGVLRLINFAHGDVFMLGAYSGLFAAVGLGVSQRAGWGSVILVIVVAMVACALVGMAIERFAYRRLRSAPRLNTLITAIGVSLLLEYGGQLPPVLRLGPVEIPFGPQQRAFPTGIIPEMSVPLWGNLQLSAVQVITFVVAIALMVGLELIIRKTRVGKAMRAVSADREAASLMGIPTDRVILYTFAFGSALAAAAGVLYALDKPTTVEPMMGLYTGLKAFVAAVLGGIGSIPGALIGGFVMGLTETLVTGYGANFGLDSTWKDAVAFGILILILIVRPSGIMGTTAKEKV